MASLLTAARRVALALFLACPATWIVGSAKAADGPGRPVVERFHQALVGIMKDAAKLGFAGRYKRVEPEVRSAFDLAQMTRLSVGAPWAELTPAQQEQAVDVFSRWTATNYAARFDGYDGEKFETTGERSTQNGTMVQTRLVKPEGEPVVLNYLMRESGGAWRIVDIYLSGTISELAVRRSEFASILKRDGFDGLMQAIEKQIAEMMSK